MTPSLLSLILLTASADTVAPLSPTAATTTREIDAHTAPARWRPDLPSLTPTDDRLRDEIARLATSCLQDPAEDSSLATAWDTLRTSLVRFDLQPGETLAFPTIHGPETPFPDHAPLQELARARLALLKHTWNTGEPEQALRLALQNRDLALAALHAQEGIVPVIAMTGVWQTALDGIYWLARQPGLTPGQAHRLQTRLSEDNHLASRALARAFAGEHAFVQSVIINRLPQTHDPELILDAIGSFGMAPPALPPEGEPRLPVGDKRPLDVAKTLEGSAANVAAYRDALVAAPERHPSTLLLARDLPARQRTAVELGPLLRYATIDEPLTPELLAAAAEVLDRVENPLGKLYLLLATPQWSPICETVYRRQAQNGALQVLLAWRRLGRPATAETLALDSLLDALPPDPFSNGPLLIDPARARVWSVGPDGADQGGAGDGDNMGRPDDLAWPSGAYP